MKFQIITLLSAILISGCQKKDSTAADPAKVIMQISTPTDGQTFHTNDTVSIKANVDYISELHGYEIKIEDTATGAVVYDKASHVHTDKIVIDDRWVAGITQPTALKLSIIVYIDHDNNSARKDVKIKINP